MDRFINGNFCTVSSTIVKIHSSTIKVRESTVKMNIYCDAKVTVLSRDRHLVAKEKAFFQRHLNNFAGAAHFSISPAASSSSSLSTIVGKGNILVVRPHVFGQAHLRRVSISPT